ncbi:LysR substrate-binding domain-containing protein [Streptomyces sp. ITFR-6]|uniref:LysR substrate-binding domain-containing protein n=1 Tax=Streptomyces sp. ITFR-6 TaxID=3075197 RepID=UPI00288B3723|nr:LysR substrate-binding domain-containing protein [Streptomyces sp. ITFR-6]WNI33882.1 LysR substrate-binding domain-containing protein [Streptomyces sp. ITFR-6]
MSATSPSSFPPPAHLPPTTNASSSTCCSRSRRISWCRGCSFAGRASVELHEADTETWLRAGDPRDQHLLLTSACAAAGFSPRVTHNAVDWSAIAALVAGGHGICLLPRLATFPRGHQLVRVPLTGDVVPTRRLVGFVRRGGGNTPLVSDGLRALRESARLGVPDLS